ncbi:MAG: LytR C-terminal domain-containing protein [Solirubrobacterales bacterium]
MELIKEIGAFAGLGAFLGLAILSLLYFSQARDLRRLRDWAGRAPERDAEEIEATSDLAAERAEELRKIEEERRAREEAARETAAKRDRRRERREAGLPEQTRWERTRERFAGGGRGRTLQPRYLAVAAGAVVVIGVSAAAATGLLGGSDDGEGSANHALKPSQVEVAVLNGTNPPVQGLAGAVGDRLEEAGFQIGVVSNSRNSFTESVVMFTRGHKPEAARVARNLGIRKVRLITPDIGADSAGGTVSVVVGQDKANFGG